MLYVNENGHIYADRIKIKIFNNIEHEKMDAVNGIVVHQTNASTASSTFHSYQNKGAAGAHFLIDRDGTIYQTASLFKVTWHVGRLQSRCYLTKKCEPADLQKVADLEKSWRNYDKVHQIEKVKNYPDRFPSNIDSIGIEIVGKAERQIDKKTGEPVFVYEDVNDRQNESLKWLIRELIGTLNVSTTEIYRHPEIGRKTLTEASTAKW
ncbi:peptidoglycan recognition protein family protein [Erwinia rhapontici]|uniref:peptidoglycan recognition protein family protein n=1 Tax=Erwinia TaxID=551 RepID=UPI0014386382|nr:peptidoglycan recognition family protein [Erwinia rhapontici]NKG29275.1 N-acetylmuramoyl-L-alanine amidase [Erwinia rhapontici]